MVQVWGCGRGRERWGKKGGQRCGSSLHLPDVRDASGTAQLWSVLAARGGGIRGGGMRACQGGGAVSYTHLRAHETLMNL
eukprot:59356-Chlamydomonas_euryale.AAC.1